MILGSRQEKYSFFQDDAKTFQNVVITKSVYFLSAISDIVVHNFSQCSMCSTTHRN